MCFTPKKNITYQRYLLHTCTKNGCSFDNFLTDIKNKAKTCEFRSLEVSLKENIRNFQKLR